jgi:hypothetical protein
MLRHLAGRFCCVLLLLARSRNVPGLDGDAACVAKATRIGDRTQSRPLTGQLRPRSEVSLQMVRPLVGRFHPMTKEAAGGLDPRRTFRAGHRMRRLPVQFLFLRMLAISPQCRPVADAVSCEANTASAVCVYLSCCRRLLCGPSEVQNLGCQGGFSS